MSLNNEVRKVTTHRLSEMKLRGEKITMLTSYDFSMASLVDEAGIDIILVGDSASNVMAGNETTLPITLDQMIYHGASVVKGVKRALVVVDLPFGTYQGNSREALISAIRIMKETAASYRIREPNFVSRNSGYGAPGTNAAIHSQIWHLYRPGQRRG